MKLEMKIVDIHGHLLQKHMADPENETGWILSDGGVEYVYTAQGAKSSLTFEGDEGAFAFGDVVTVTVAKA